MAIMTSRQAAEFDHALERNGWTAEDVKKVSGGDLLARLLLVVRDLADVVVMKLLTIVRRVSIAAQPTITTSEEYFKEAGVVWMDENFKAQFLGLEVAAIGETELTIRKLEVASVDDPIIAELGGKEKAEISVSQFRAFLAANRDSSERFIFYLKGKDGNLWAVRARWRRVRRCWGVGAHPVDGPGEWGSGGRVLSR